MRAVHELRMTSQRRIILEELRKVATHPTADQLYLSVRERLPRISLATVYRNLELLVREGLIQRVEFGGSQMRFDGNPDAHHHLRCLSCGEVRDAGARIPSLQRAMRPGSGYEITGYHLEFTGFCARCRKDKIDSAMQYNQH